MLKGMEEPVKNRTRAYDSDNFIVKYPGNINIRESQFKPAECMEMKDDDEAIFEPTNSLTNSSDQLAEIKR